MGVFVPLLNILRVRLDLEFRGNAAHQIFGLHAARLPLSVDLLVGASAEEISGDGHSTVPGVQPALSRPDRDLIEM